MFTRYLVIFAIICKVNIITSGLQIGGGGGRTLKLRENSLLMSSWQKNLNWALPDSQLREPF